jgi:hypothetical protein
MSELENGCCTSPLVGEAAIEQSEVAGEGCLATGSFLSSMGIFWRIKTPHPAFHADFYHKGRGKNAAHIELPCALVIWHDTHRVSSCKSGKP